MHADVVRRVVVGALAALLAVWGLPSLPAAGAQDPPPTSSEGWVGTIDVSYTWEMPGGSYEEEYLFEFSRDLFVEAMSWREAFGEIASPMDRLWRQGYDVTYTRDWTRSRTVYTGPSGSESCVSTGFERVAPTSVRMTAPLLEGPYGQLGGWYGQISIGQRVEAGEQRLDFDLQPVIPVTIEFYDSGDCSANPHPVSETHVGEIQPSVDLTNGLGLNLPSGDRSIGAPASWPALAPPGQPVTLVGSKTISGAIPELQWSDATTITWNLLWDPGLPDLDGDGVPDEIDACPTVPGPASNDGCPPADDDVDCDGLVDVRGYVVSEHRAELDTLFGDPDVFSFATSARWCSVDGSIDLGPLDVQGYVELDPLLATALELLGFTFVYSPERSYAVGSTTSSAARVIGYGAFDACFDWFALAGGAVNKVLAPLATRVARTMQAPLRRVAASTETLVDDLVGRADQTVGQALQRLQSQLDRSIQRATRRLPDGIGAALRDGVEAALDDLADTVLRDLRAVLADGVDDIAAAAPRLRQAATAKVVAAIESHIQSKLLGLLGAQSCFALWEPMVTLTIPSNGPSSVVSGGFVNPFLAVRGEITTDVRTGA